MVKFAARFNGPPDAVHRGAAYGVVAAPVKLHPTGRPAIGA